MLDVTANCWFVDQGSLISLCSPFPSRAKLLSSISTPEHVPQHEAAIMFCFVSLREMTETMVYHRHYSLAHIL